MPFPNSSAGNHRKPYTRWRCAKYAFADRRPDQRRFASCWATSFVAIGKGLGAKLPPEKLDAGIESFCQTIFDRWSELTIDPIPVAAWAEWELNGGSLHPFYDGCGRISRSFSAILLLRGGLPPPLHTTLAEYFAKGNCSIDAFTTYMRNGITQSREWIARLDRG